MVFLPLVPATLLPSKRQNIIVSGNDIIYPMDQIRITLVRTFFFYIIILHTNNILHSVPVALHGTMVLNQQNRQKLLIIIGVKKKVKHK